MIEYINNKVIKELEETKKEWFTVLLNISYNTVDIYLKANGLDNKDFMEMSEDSDIYFYEEMNIETLEELKETCKFTIVNEKVV